MIEYLNNEETCFPFIKFIFFFTTKITEKKFSFYSLSVKV